MAGDLLTLLCMDPIASPTFLPALPVGRWAARLAALSLILAPGCLSLRRPLPVVDRSHDATIRAEVSSRLEAEPAIGPGRIRVAVDAGVVRLYGAVDGLAAWECALRNAGLVARVRSVVDFLVIEPGPRSVACLAPAPALEPEPEPQPEALPIVPPRSATDPSPGKLARDLPPGAVRRAASVPVFVHPLHPSAR